MNLKFWRKKQLKMESQRERELRELHEYLVTLRDDELRFVIKMMKKEENMRRPMSLVELKQIVGSRA